MAGVERFNGEFDAVLDAAQSGAPWAFERIFTALSPVVTGYLRAQGAHEPEDLSSEVFVAVLRNIGRFTGGEAAFRSWVFTIAHRRLLDERRRHGRRPPLTALSHAREPGGAAVRSWLSTRAPRRRLDAPRRHGRRPPLTALSDALELAGPDDVEGAVE